MVLIAGVTQDFLSRCGPDSNDRLMLNRFASCGVFRPDFQLNGKSRCAVQIRGHVIAGSALGLQLKRTPALDEFC